MRISHQEDRCPFGAVFVLVSTLTLAACGGGGGGSDPAVAPPPHTNDAGTIAFQVTPAGSDSTDDLLLTIGNRGQTSDRMTVVRNGTDLQVLVINSAGEQSSVGVSISDWQPGQAHTVTFVWGDGVEQLYIDGQLADQGDHLGVLQLPMGITGLSGSIHDFKVFARPLTPEEVATLPTGPNPSEVSLRVRSTSVAEPESAGTVCVDLVGGTGFVAGTQNDLVWDPGCMEISEPCAANPRHGKSVRTGLRQGPRLKAILFSLTNTDPIDDGELYCCPFRIASIPSGACCAVRIQNTLGSDSVGHAIATEGVDGQICLR
jgi:hypothetical protein